MTRTKNSANILGGILCLIAAMAVSLHVARCTLLLVHELVSAGSSAMVKAAAERVTLTPTPGRNPSTPTNPTATPHRHR